MLCITLMVQKCIEPTRTFSYIVRLVYNITLGTYNFFSSKDMRIDVYTYNTC